MPGQNADIGTIFVSKSTLCAPLTREEVQQRDVIIDGVYLVPSADGCTCSHTYCTSDQFNILVIASCT